MRLRVVGAGSPRTGTSSLKHALQRLLGGPCHHMSAIPGHPFDLGDAWDRALAGGPPDWDALLGGFVAVVDWPGSLFWQPLAAAHPDALVVLSVREGGAAAWYDSADPTILPYARRAAAADWDGGRGIAKIVERFAGTADWDHRDVLMAAYDRHDAAVRAGVPRERLLEWRATEGWGPLCAALGVPAPDEPFPWRSKREEW